MLTADAAAMWDSKIYNPGFIAVKPTNISKRLYQMMRTITSRSTTNDQRALNIAIGILKSKGVGRNLTSLNKQRYLGGLDYFENQRHFFAPEDGQKCSQQKQAQCAVVVHNTWIISKAAKVYRFRENLMWMYDGDDKYYSSSTRLYLLYNDHAPALQRSVPEKSDIYQLKTALTIGYLLNRTVILPRFHSRKVSTLVPLHYVLHIQTFDDSFSGKYRENSFLRHPKVPLDVKSGQSAEVRRLHVINESLNSTIYGENTVVSAADVVRQFGHMNDKVLKFGSLHGVTVVLGNSGEDATFKRKLRHAFHRSSHKQFRRQGQW